MESTNQVSGLRDLFVRKNTQFVGHLSWNIAQNFATFVILAEEPGHLLCRSAMISGSNLGPHGVWLRTFLGPSDSNYPACFGGTL